MEIWILWPFFGTESTMRKNGFKPAFRSRRDNSSCLVGQNPYHPRIRALPVCAPSLRRSRKSIQNREYRILLLSVGRHASHPHWRNVRNIAVKSKKFRFCKQAVQKPYLTLTRWLPTPKATIWFKHCIFSHWLMTTRKLFSFSFFDFIRPQI